MDSDILRRAKLRAIHLLEYRDRTEKDMRRKLQQGDYPLEVIDKTIEYLKSYGYIDDKRYAGRYLSMRLGGKGRRRLFMELQQKGVDPSLAQEAWMEICQEEDINERAAIRRLIEKKVGERTRLPCKEYQRLLNYLARRGFSWEDISAELEENGIEPEG